MRATGMTGYQIAHQAVSPAVHVIAVGGELDMGASPDLRGTIDGALESGVSLLVMDLTELTFIDSTGISTLVAAFRRLSESGGSLELVCSDRNVLRVLELTGLDEVLSIHSSRDQAREVFAGTRGGA
jgi:anti-sigma B factor antagonist